MHLIVIRYWHWDGVDINSLQLKTKAIGFNLLLKSMDGEHVGTRVTKILLQLNFDSRYVVACCSDRAHAAGLPHDHQTSNQNGLIAVHSAA